MFDHLTENLGLAAFLELFSVILTDNGVEFKDPISLEHSTTNCLRTHIFFLGWVFSLGEGVRVTGPEAVVQRMREEAARLSSQYPLV